MSPLSPSSPPVAPRSAPALDLSGRPLLSLREVAAPPGWTAALLEMNLPAEGPILQRYAAVVTELLAHIPAFERSAADELFLQFDRCAPDREVPILQQNARSWQPEFGLGVWLDKGPPTLWSKDEFLAAAPGTLRPVINRVVRIQTDAAVQAVAWRRLLGSGVLVRVASSRPGAFLDATAEAFLPRITEPALASFPFFLPLLTLASLHQPHWTFPGALETWLPEADGYMRESSEDGGLLLLVRQRPETFWAPLTVKPLGITPARLEPPPGAAKP